MSTSLLVLHYSLLGLKKRVLPQIIRYEAGEKFEEHCDAQSGLYSGGGFVNSARLVTVFAYLTDSPRGGATRFTKLGLDVRPKRGMGVIHFPGFEYQGRQMRDVRTVHEGAPAVDEKWLIATWMWKDQRAVSGPGTNLDTDYPSLSSDII